MIRSAQGLTPALPRRPYLPLTRCALIAALRRPPFPCGKWRRGGDWLAFGHRYAACCARPIFGALRRTRVLIPRKRKICLRQMAERGGFEGKLKASLGVIIQQHPELAALLNTLTAPHTTVVTCPVLAKVVQQWQTLPEALQAAIAAMIMTNEAATRKLRLTPPSLDIGS